ncbi:MAG: glutathione S-transferase [Pseudomonadota bacterium]
MITVHHLENSRSQRTLWMLEALGVDYDIKRYSRDPATSLAPPELKAVHPLGKSPVITDGDITVAESGAIVEYLMEHYSGGKLQPADTPEARRDYTYWLHYAEGTMMPLLIIALLLRRVDEAKVPFFVKPIARGITGKLREAYLDRNLAANMKFMESTLADRPWFTGDHLTAADIHMSFILEGLNVSTDLESDFPNMAACLKRCHDDKNYQRAIERGGPFHLGG